MTLFGKKVFADVMKSLELRSFWMKEGPASRDWYHVLQGKEGGKI